MRHPKQSRHLRLRAGSMPNLSFGSAAPQQPPEAFFAPSAATGAAAIFADDE